jgi:hypothetical protein
MRRQAGSYAGIWSPENNHSSTQAPVLASDCPNGRGHDRVYPDPAMAGKTTTAHKIATACAMLTPKIERVK